MNNILCVFNDAKDSRYRDLGQQFVKMEGESSEWAVEYVETLESFQRALEKQAFAFLIFIFEEGPSKELLDFISKSRNATHLRETQMASIHKRTTPQSLQKTLMMGVKSIFAEPIEKKMVLVRLRATSDSMRPAIFLGLDFDRVEPIPFEGEVFGRVGKILVSPLGDMQVETDVRFPEGKLIQMRSKIAKDLGLAKFHFHVRATLLEDTYYQYGYSYRLAIDADAPLNRQLANWVKTKAGECFVLPKTKVLWVGSGASFSLPSRLESLFDKTIFSVRVEKPGKCTPQFLSNLSPKILIVGDVPAPTLESIRNWLYGRPKGERMVFTTAQGHPSDWIRLQELSSEAMQSTFLALVRPFLHRRLETSIENAKYLSRKSDYSRCSFPVAGKVLRSSGAYVELEMDYILDKGCIFLATRPFSAYLKVVHVEAFLNKSTFHITCEYVPFTEKAARYLKDLPHRENSEKGLSTPEKSLVNEAPKQGNELFFLESRPFWVDTGKVLVGLLVAGLICGFLYWVFPGTSSEGGSSSPPVSMDDFFQAVRNAFK